ncbi:MAG: NAD(P)/FAD-dependent oxidoreductase, partial [Myxococcota bacterium]
ARWNWDHDLEGETVGVIGSAGSSVQLIPEIVKRAGQVHLFQRTANWVLPKEDDPYTEEQLERFRTDPEAALAVRQEIYDGIESGMAFTDAEARGGLEAEVLKAIEVVEDPELRAKLVPDHIWGCKRPLFSNDYYLAFNRPNLELVTDAIERITPKSIVTVDGKERTVDTLILATGFSATKYLSAIEVSGRKGIRIADAWSDGAQAYMGVTTAGFPNLFMLYGPNTNQGSIITMIEWQVEHALQHIERIAKEDLVWVDVKPELMAEYNVQIQKDIDAIVPWQAGCNGYYRSPSGRVVTQWPHKMGDFKRLVATLDPEAYEVEAR